MSIGIAEIAVIAVAMLVLLRPGELGKLARFVGRSYRKMQRLRSEARDMLQDRDVFGNEGGQS